MTPWVELSMNTPDERPQGTSPRLMIIAGLAFVAVVASAYLLVNHSHTDSSTNQIVLPTSITPPAPVEPQVSEPAIPTEAPTGTANNLAKRTLVPPPRSLDNSDIQVKLAVADLAPDMAEWLASDQQLRKWVLAIDLMADGHVPKQYRPLAFPITRFEPAVFGSEAHAQFSMKPESFTRADGLVKLLTAIDPDVLAQYYRSWLPILEKAYAEQGKKDKFDQRFRAALQQVIDVKPLEANPVLKKRGGVIYVYADDKLEAASDVEKMLWRLGPDNSSKLQTFAQQLQQHLPKTK
jgi:hypothetical protein